MPNVYAKFVSDNYARIAAKNPGKTPQEHMKLIAADYRAKHGLKKPAKKVVKKGRGKSTAEILKNDAIKIEGNPDNLVGKPTPDGKNVWYKYDVPGKFPGSYAAAPGKHIMDNVNNIYTKDGAIYINKRFMTPFMKNMAGLGGELYNYKNPGRLGFFEAIPRALFDGDNYKIAYDYWKKYIAPAANIVLKPVGALIGGKIEGAFNDAINRDLGELFPEEKKQGGARRIRRG